MKFTQEIENEDGWTDFIEPKDLENYKIACCDCGLVHKLELTVAIVEQNGSKRDYIPLDSHNRLGKKTLTVLLRASRDNRATGQRRRKLKGANK